MLNNNLLRDAFFVNISDCQNNACVNFFQFIPFDDWVCISSAPNEIIYERTESFTWPKNISNDSKKTKKLKIISNYALVSNLELDSIIVKFNFKEKKGLS